MGVKKPLEKLKNSPEDIEKLINKGALVKEDTQKEKNKWMYINLRIPIEMVINIDEKVKDRIGMTRTGWILECINEKIKKI